MACRIKAGANHSAVRISKEVPECFEQLVIQEAGDKEYLMAKIEENDIFTQVVRFDVTADKQLVLIEAIAAEVERWVRYRPGFVSSTFHASLDGKAVLNYAQWESEDDFEGFTQDPETARLRKAVTDVDPSLNPYAIQCRVVRSIDRAS